MQEKYQEASESVYTLVRDRSLVQQRVRPERRRQSAPALDPRQLAGHAVVHERRPGDVQSDVEPGRHTPAGATMKQLWIDKWLLICAAIGGFVFGLLVNGENQWWLTAAFIVFMLVSGLSARLVHGWRERKLAGRP